jgi:8-oxo-dGTP pyrophosphatase MutT (NUDIX family)
VDFAEGYADSPSRDDVIAELSLYRAREPREAAMSQALLHFVRAEPRCFERSLEEGHVTGSAWIVDRALRHTLLTHHRKLGKWLQLGGHADGDSDIRRVALREAREESGLTNLVPALAGIYDVDIHEIPARGVEPAHLHYDLRFVFFADPAEPLHLSDESHALAWVRLDAVRALGVDDSVLRLVAKTPQLGSSEP